MARRISKISKSLKELGEIQINDWELPKVINTDLSEIEIRRAIQKLGDIQVTEWELGDIIPSLQKLAQKEVDIVGLIKQVADYKVTDWDLKEAIRGSKASAKPLSKSKLKRITTQLQGYLEYVIGGLIKEPRYASFQCDEIAPKVLCFRVILTQADLARLIGMGGMTAGPIRRILKDVALHRGVHALLCLQTHGQAARQDGMQ